MNDLKWPASIMLNKAENFTMIGNSVAGSEKIGIKTNGFSCSDDTSSLKVRDNEVHSCLHGIHMKDKTSDCIKYEHYLLWKNLDFGIYAWPSKSVMVRNMIFADNKIALYTNVGTPNSIRHEYADQTVSVENSLVVGQSSNFECADNDIIPHHSTFYPTRRSPRPRGGKFIVFVIFSVYVLLGPQGGRVMASFDIFQSVKT